jgi:sulfite dehydrogenase
VDGGATWNRARLDGPDLGPTAWRRFVFEFEATRGVHQLASRARDAQGNVQPEHRQPNERGYGNNSWRDPLVEITVP